MRETDLTDTAVRLPTQFDGAGLLAAFDGDVADVRDMVALVTATIPKYVADLEQAGLTGDTRALSALAHTIRGSVGNIGATRLAGLAHGIEMSVRAGTGVGEADLRAVRLATADLIADITAWEQTLGTPSGR